MFGMGIGELIVLAVVALLFLGPEKLPGAAKTISKGIRDFRKQTRDLQNTLENDNEIGGAIRDLKSALRGDFIESQISDSAKPSETSTDSPAAAVGEPDGSAASDETAAKESAGSDDPASLFKSAAGTVAKDPPGNAVPEQPATASATPNNSLSSSESPSTSSEPQPPKSAPPETVVSQTPPPKRHG